MNPMNVCASQFLNHLRSTTAATRDGRLPGSRPARWPFARQRATRWPFARQRTAAHPFLAKISPPPPGRGLAGSSPGSSPSWPKVQGLTPHSRLENKMYIRWATHFLAYYVRPVDLLCPPFGFAHFISVATERPANKLDAGTSDSRSTGATDAKAMCCCVCALACLPPLSAQC